MLDSVDLLVNNIDLYVNTPGVNFMAKTHAIIDEHGEIHEVEGRFAFIPAKRSNGFGKDWLAMSQPATKYVAKLKLTGVEFSVFMMLLSELDYENLIAVNQSKIATELEIDRAQVNRAVKRLLSVKAILEGPRIGVSRSYRLNPAYGWKGSGKNHKQALKDYQDNILQFPERDPLTVDFINGKPDSE